MTDELIREVDQAIRQDKWQTLWNDHAKNIVFGAIAFLVLVAATISFRGYQQGVAEKETDTILAAHTFYVSTRYEEARDMLLEAVESAGGDRQAFMQLWLSKIYLKLNDEEQALSTLDTIIKNQGNTKPLARLACVNGLLISPSDERFSECRTSHAKDPFGPLTRELEAVRLADKQAYKEAADILPELNQLPTSQKRRLTDLSAYLSSSVHAQP